MRPRITVIGVGGAGGNAVNNMIRSDLQGVEFLVANTDAQALGLSDTPNRIRLGANLTNGLGTGAEPDIGRAAAEEALDEVMAEIESCHMLFITAGMGGGTGTGAAPVIARAARERGVLTVGVVTKPFNFEGTRRMRAAENGIEELAKFVDTLIVIPNQNLFQVADPRTTLAEVFQMADEVLQSGVRGVTDLMIKPGLVNLDFADIRSVMREMGKAMMGTGEAEGETRAIDAAEAAIDNPLLDDKSMRGAQAVLINITGGFDMGLMEVDEAANRIRREVDDNTNIVFGSTLDESMTNKMRVSVVATGIDTEFRRATDPVAPNVAVARATAEQESMKATPPTPQRRGWFGLPGLLGRDADETANEFSTLELSISSKNFVDQYRATLSGKDRMANRDSNSVYWFEDLSRMIDPRSRNSQSGTQPQEWNRSALNKASTAHSQEAGIFRVAAGYFRPLSDGIAMHLTLHPLQEWEGYVVEVGDGEFTGRLTDLTAGHSYETEEAVVPFEELSDYDRAKLRKGDIFRWVIGYERSPSGTKKRVSQIVFRDIPAMTKSDFRTGSEWARGIAQSFRE
ncbi:MAG: cell division protein FtsZ [Alphaproteobacteria bacterium]|nr:cell division protein FtsZ [Alphaproteobacteria bacterium]